MGRLRYIHLSRQLVEAQISSNKQVIFVSFLNDYLCKVNKGRAHHRLLTSMLEFT